MSYIDLEYVKANGRLTPAAVDQYVHDLGEIEPIIAGRSAYIDSRLYKRYATPFESPVPTVVKDWCCDLVVEIMLSRRGDNPDSDLSLQVKEAAERARADLKEAADSKDGLFDLPVRQVLPTDSGISRGGPLGYSEASPYDSRDAQMEALRGR